MQILTESYKHMKNFQIKHVHNYTWRHSAIPNFKNGGATLQ